MKEETSAKDIAFESSDRGGEFYSKGNASPRRYSAFSWESLMTGSEN